LEWGDELSARHAQSASAGTWDFVHVAAAQRVRTEMFITCDSAQAELAKVAGLTRVHLFEI
jgi:predicted nucleic acid-binding protein